MRGKLVARLFRLVFGLFLYALGIALTINAHIGYAPWDVFHAGLGKALGLTIGTASILAGFVIIAITALMGEKIGLGTILNMLLIGMFLDVILASETIPVMDSMPLGVLMLIGGLFVISLASYFYIGSCFGTGPRDGLMVALTRKLKLPIGVIRSAIEVSAIVLGWALGGMAGVGTLLSGGLIGLCIQSTFRVLHFDPTQIVQSDMKESFHELRLALAEKAE